MSTKEEGDFSRIHMIQMGAHVIAGDCKLKKKLVNKWNLGNEKFSDPF